MMNRKDHYSLRAHNTFNIEATAAQFVEYESVEELQAFVQQRSAAGDASPLLHIGGGSNLLFLGDFEGTVLHSRITGTEVTGDDGELICVRVGAGVVWDEWVEQATASGWHGLENLSLIPGEVGASAIQNIGAYGAEAGDVIDRVEAIDLQTGEQRIFEAGECQYAYRHSIFKTGLRGRYAVTHVHFRLHHTFRPQLDYGGIRQALDRKGIDPATLTATQLRQTIIEIRRSKLPEPRELGNAGSFFTNPIVERETYERLAALYPTLPHYEVDSRHVKIPAGWMIEQCGWKGRSLGRVGVYEKQALVLVNRGGATGAEVASLCAAIQADVQARFGLLITPEVNFIG